MPQDTDDKDRNVRVYTNAQFAIRAIIQKGSTDEKRDHFSIGQRELFDSLAMAIAMIIEADSTKKTKRDIREVSETAAKLIASFANVLRDESDSSGTHVLDHIIASTSTSH